MTVEPTRYYQVGGPDMVAKAERDLRDFHSLLHNLVVDKRAWIERHPDHESEAFEDDYVEYDNAEFDGVAWQPSGKSSFDPQDIMPNTAIVVTAEAMDALLTSVVHLLDERYV
jgi:hypothetical protein